MTTDYKLTFGNMNIQKVELEFSFYVANIKLVAVTFYQKY